MSVRAILFDLDGVVRHWDPSLIRDAEALEGLPPGTLASVAFDPAVLHPAITGAVSDGRWRSAIARELSERYGVDGARVVTAWSLAAGAVNGPVLELVRRERSRRRVGLLTNATTRLDQDLAELGLADEFDAIFSSAVLGHAKPSEPTFRRVLDQLSEEPGAVAFVDDTPANVEAAASLGLVAHCYRTEDDLTAFLDDLP